MSIINLYQKNRRASDKPSFNKPLHILYYIHIYIYNDKSLHILEMYSFKKV